ncbi:unnamed protein product [Arctogadus glacialis]
MHKMAQPQKENRKWRLTSAMKVWARSARPWQVALLVAVVMLCADPVSAGNRNHRGQTGATETPPATVSTVTDCLRGDGWCCCAFDREQSVA